jgi:hypothetical protein
MNGRCLTETEHREGKWKGVDAKWSYCARSRSVLVAYSDPSVPQL